MMCRAFSISDVSRGAGMLRFELFTSRLYPEVFGNLGRYQ